MIFEPHQVWYSGGKIGDDYFAIVEKFESEDEGKPPFYASSVFVEPENPDEDGHFTHCISTADAADYKTAVKLCKEAYDSWKSAGIK